MRREMAALSWMLLALGVVGFFGFVVLLLTLALGF